MAIIDINDVKAAFETGDRPTGADFVNLIDTLAANATLLGAGSNNDSIITGIENETVVDSLVASDWRFIRYMVSLTSTISGSNKHYATEITVLLDNNNVNISEYGSLDNDGDVGTVTVSKVSGAIQLIVTPDPQTKPVTLRFSRIGLKA
jgi:hypothetical protein